HETVAARWLDRISRPLAIIADRSGPAEDRLREWVRTLARLKRHKVCDDPQMFAAYSTLAGSARCVASAHIATLKSQLLRILQDGCSEGVFQIRNLARAADAIQNATLRFHHPQLLRPPASLPTTHELESVLNLVIGGLKAGTT